jgi:tetratricopeptide (TPR) repeat protein
MLVAAAAGLVVLGLVGCQSPHKGQQEAKARASERWLGMRSTMMLQMAQQQFDTGDLDQCEKTLLEAIDLDARNARLHVLAGRVGLERGQLERGYQRLDTAIALDDSLPEAHYFQGVILQRWQRYEQALEAYRAAYQRQADNPAYLLPVADMLVELDRAPEAIQLLESKVVYFDQNASVRAALGQLYSSQNDFAKAAEYFKQANLLKPDDLGVAQELATAQVQAGQTEEGIRNFERLCADKNLAGRRDLQTALAGAYRAAGRTADARNVYLKLTHADPRDADAWAQLAEIAWAQGDTAGTLVAATKVIALSPKRQEGYLLAGLVWQKRENFDEALKMFDKASELSPQSSEPSILRGITLEKAGKREAAARAYKDALQRQPEDPRAQRLLANVEDSGRLGR